MTALEKLRFEQMVRHLHRLGARATSEFLLEVMARVGGKPAVMAALAEWATLSPGQVRAAQADRFPVPVRAAPADLRRAAG